MSADDYEQRLAAWKAKMGFPEGTAGDAGEIDGETLMIAQDAKRKGRDYCGRCTERFKICDMRLITRKDDPYIQMDESESPGKPDWWIAVGERVRMCKPCFKIEYESEEGE